jgi:hypothetical protein
VPLTGCDLLPRPDPAEPPGPSADERLVERVAAEIRAARDLAAGVPQGRALVAAHQEHLAALGPAATPSPTESSAESSASSSASSSPTPGSAATPADLRTTELRLEAALTDAAGRAADGGLARLLASMAASVAQHLAVLPAATGGGR